MDAVAAPRATHIPTKAAAWATSGQASIPDGETMRREHFVLTPPYRRCGGGGSDHHRARGPALQTSRLQRSRVREGRSRRRTANRNKCGCGTKNLSRQNFRQEAGEY